MAEHSKNNKQQKDLVNRNIRAREVLIIHDDGKKQGPINKHQALNLASEVGLDIVQVGEQPNGVAIVKFLDYGKFKYQQKQKAKQSKKNQVKVENREIRLTPTIGNHDLEVKTKKAREFLQDGNRVKVSLKFRGREMAFQEYGLKTLNKFYEQVSDIAKIEKEPKLNTRFLDMYLVPNNKKNGGKNNAKNED